MTNKPMLSVERELLERILDSIRFGEREELKAILDNQTPSNEQVAGLVPAELVALLRADLRQEVESARLSLAAQHQGKPVAICRLWNEGGSGERTSVEFIGEPCADGTLLYAEQPAPVAVVMPERQIVPDNLMAGLTRKWCEGWNDALEEVARLNGVKP